MGSILGSPILGNYQINFLLVRSFPRERFRQSSKLCLKQVGDSEKWAPFGEFLHSAFCCSGAEALGHPIHQLLSQQVLQALATPNPS